MTFSCPSCVTCADEAIPMRVLRSAGEGLALCLDEDGREREVMTALLAGASAAPGEILLVHAGTALARLGPRPDLEGGRGALEAR